MGELMHPYQLVHFLGEFHEDGSKLVECVPKSWISYNEKLRTCEAHYMEPPYNEEDKQLIRDLIKELADAPESWPSFKVQLLGHAKTHTEGLRRVRKLKNQPYAYTTETDDDGTRKSREMVNFYKNKKSNVISAAELLNPKSLPSESENSQSISDAETDTLSSSASDTRKKKSESLQRQTKATRKGKSYNKLPAEKTVVKTKAQIHISKVSQPTSTDDRQTKELEAPIQSMKSHNDRKDPSKSSAGQDQHENIPKVDQKDNDRVVGSNDYKLMYLSLTNLIAVIKNQSEEIRDLRQTVERSLNVKGHQITTNTFAEKYGFQKLMSFEDFQSFDDRLKEDETFRKDFTAALECIVEKDMRKTTNAIIKKFFDKQLALKCTTVRESKIKGEKLVLKGSILYEKLFEFVRRTHSEIEGVTEKTFNQSLATSLNNAKDWEGGRKNRALPKISEQKI